MTAIERNRVIAEADRDLDAATTHEPRRLAPHDSYSPGRFSFGNQPRLASTGTACANAYASQPIDIRFGSCNGFFACGNAGSNGDSIGNHSCNSGVPLVCASGGIGNNKNNAP